MTTRWIISAFVFALLLLLLSGWRYRGKDHAAISVGIGGLSGFCSGLAQTGGPPIVGYWLGRPIRFRRSPAPTSCCSSAPRISFPPSAMPLTGLITMDAIKFSLVVGPVYARRRLVRRLAVRQAPAKPLFRAICYALIAAAVIFGLPALDGVLR